MRSFMLAFLAVLSQSAVAHAAILGFIDFESHPAGAVYGHPSIPPGSLAFMEAGVPVRVDNFTLASGGTTYDSARINVSATGQSLELNNVLLSMDFSAFHGTVKEITLEYQDLVGEKNLRVNGGPLHTGNLTSFPSSIAPGVELYYTRIPIPGPTIGTRGKLVLHGVIEKLELGGQEFFIDNILWSSCQ